MKVKGLTVFFVLCIILLLVPSCKKNSQTQNSGTEENEVKASSFSEESSDIKTAEKSETFSTKKENRTIADSAEENKVSEAFGLDNDDNIILQPVEEPLFEDTLSYRGFSTDIRVFNDKTVLTLPEGLGEEEVGRLSELIIKAYPAQASQVTYSLEGNTLVLSYPEQSGEYLNSCIDTLTEDAVRLLDSYNIVNEEEETANTETKPVFSDTLKYRGYTTEVAVFNDHAIITLPEGIGEKEVASTASLFLSLYPEEAALVAYDLKDGILTLTYPEQSDEYLLAAVNPVLEQTFILLDGEMPTQKDERGIENVIVPLSDEEESISMRYTYNGFSSDITVTESEATFTLDEEVTELDIAHIAQELSSLYPVEAQYVTYVFEKGKVSLYYPEQSMDYLTEVLHILEDKAVVYIESLSSTVKEETEEGQTDNISDSQTVKTQDNKVNAIAEHPLSSVNMYVKEVKEKDLYKGWSLAFAYAGKWNFHEKSWINGFEGRAQLDYSMFSIGLKGGYDLNKEILCIAYAGFTFFSSEKIGLYGTFGGGVSFKIAAENSDLSVLADATLGLEYEMSEKLTLFAEAAFKWNIRKNIFALGASAGARLRF